MGLRKGGNKAVASGERETTISVPVALESKGVREELDVEEMEERAGSCNLEGPPVIGSDKISADYYFDSYSPANGQTLPFCLLASWQKISGKMNRKIFESQLLAYLSFVLVLSGSCI